MKMNRYISAVLSSIVILFCVCFCHLAEAAGCGQQNCPTNCGVDYKNGYFTHKCGASVSAKCVNDVVNSTEGACFNSLPVSWAGSISPQCYRANGAGGNPKPRNHYGTDIGGAGKTGILVKAAADGTIEWTGTAGGSGRTTVIEHTKKCTTSGKQSPKYHTVYRHLFKYLKTGGGVSKGDDIGVEGGSNSKKGGLPCDNTAQKNLAGYTRAGCPGLTPQGYAIHLHLEIQDGPASGSNTQAKASATIDGYCDNIQNLCGGCSNNVSKCDNGHVEPSGEYDGETAAADMENGSLEVQEKTCEYTGTYLDADQCIFCELFKTIFNTSSVIAKTANDGLSKPSAQLVSIGFMIWLAFYILKNVASFGATGPGEMLKGILFQGARVTVIVLILNTAMYQVLDLTLTPVLQTGLSFAQSLNGDSKCDTGASYMQNIKGYDAAKGYQADSDGGLSQQIGGSFVCSIKNLEDSLSFLMALGEYSICLSFHDYILAKAIPHLGFFTTGVMLLVIGFIILLAFPWFLVDCVLQLCIAAALIPCAIAAYAFKVTSKYLKVIWNFFMNAMFTFVFMSIIVYILLSNLKDWIGISPGDSAVDPRIFVNATGAGVAWWGVFAFKILGICLFCYVFFDEAKEMASKFADAPTLGGGRGIGTKIGGAGAQAAGKFGGTAVKGIWTGGKGAVQGIGQGTADVINAHFGNDIRSFANQAKGRAFSLFGGRTVTGSDGSTTAYALKTRMFGHEVNRTFTKDENGKWTETKESHKYSNYDKDFAPQTDKLGNVQRDEDGNIIFNKIKRNWRGKIVSSEQMTKSFNSETGEFEYTTADGESKIRTDKDGNVLAYKREKDSDLKVARENKSKRSINDSFLSIKERRDRHGDVVGLEIDAKNVSSRYLVDADGFVNNHAVKQIMNSSEDKEMAARFILGKVMEQRGMPLDTRFQDTATRINEDGSMSLVQIENNGSVTKIKAHFVDNQLVINHVSTDANGNVTAVSSNGLMSRTERFTQKRNGKIEKQTFYKFSDKVYSNNGGMSPLGRDGSWSSNYLSENGLQEFKQQAMVGFGTEDIDKFVDQLNNATLIQDVTQGDLHSKLDDLLNPNSGNNPDLEERAEREDAERQRSEREEEERKRKEEEERRDGN